MPDVQLAIHRHPAESRTCTPRRRDASNVRVLAADAPLPPLLAAARALVTAYRTVAIDALLFGIPLLVIGLPKSHTVRGDAGAMAGATSTDEIGRRSRESCMIREFPASRSKLAGPRSPAGVPLRDRPRPSPFSEGKE